VLRKRFPDENFIIEDFIPFADVLPYCDVYITNGGYGGVMLGIQHKVPMVVAGVHEGKNEIAARVGYFKLGVNLKTEQPTAEQIVNAVDKVTSDVVYKTNVSKLAREFSQYKPESILDGYLCRLFGGTQAFTRRSRNALHNMI
jgi:UDP:flavonoid glycosyltransferase YjiC (YdhE family)